MYVNKKMCGDSNEMREMTSRICRDYLNGAWKSVTAQTIGFKHISGGLSNWLYHVWLPETAEGKDDLKTGPREVLVRLYGQTHGERALEALITESVVFTLLSERGLGPKLHGVFPGGRIEEYINARPLLTKELSDSTLSAQISRKMAAIHQMEVPLNKEPRWLWNTMERWLVTCLKRLTSDVPGIPNQLLQCDLKKETQWLKQKIEGTPSPVVFCHNDFQEGNILLCPPECNENNNNEPKIVLIDFEYCSYNYRAFDLANHFIEWTYDYTESNAPYFKEMLSNYPTKQQRLHFIKNYLHQRKSKENPMILLDEIKVYTLASHLFWTQWAIVNAASSQITFGYWEYAVSRLNQYLRLKAELEGGVPTNKRKFEVVD